MKIKPALRFVSDLSLLVEWPGPAALATAVQVHTLFELLQPVAERWGIHNLHPAYCSLLIDFDPRVTAPTALLDFVGAQARRLGEIAVPSRPLIILPVRYDGEDLAEVARATKLSVQEVIQRHSAVEYRVGFLGFAPGFPYLLGLDPKLNCRRRASPRVRVPAGSVALAGEQTGIYSADSPGGWNIIGHTEVELFNPRRDPPTQLQPGDRLRFEVVREPRPQKKKPPPPAPLRSGEPLLEIIEPGFFSTVQDVGRKHFAHLGISAGGAADPLALEVGNRLLGNSDSAAALEMTASGATVRFVRDTWIAVTGAACEIALDDRALEMWKPVPVFAGQVMRAGVSEGLRTYLNVRAGFAAEEILGSRATFINGGWGGMEGRALRAGDILRQAGEIAGPPLIRAGSRTLPLWYRERRRTLRVLKGPQWEWFTPESRRAFFVSEFEISEEVNRLGLRLIGQNLEYQAVRVGEEMVSEGIAGGAIQVPAGGQPLILFCEQRTTGGYPKIANVIGADLFLLGQLKPGDKVRFREVSLEAAWLAGHEVKEALQRLGFVG